MIKLHLSIYILRENCSSSLPGTLLSSIHRPISFSLFIAIQLHSLSLLQVKAQILCYILWTILTFLCFHLIPPCSLFRSNFPFQICQNILFILPFPFCFPFSQSVRKILVFFSWLPQLTKKPNQTKITYKNQLSLFYKHLLWQFSCLSQVENVQREQTCVYLYQSINRLSFPT